MGKNLTWLLLLASAALAQPGIEGTWQGTLNAGAVKLRMGLHIMRTEAGQLTSKLDSIDQNVMGIPVRETTFADNKLHLEMPNMGAKYDGTLSADGNEITGTFTQGGPVRLIFKRVEKIEELNRPQNPKPPFSYESVEVSYENKAAMVTLAGTLTVPRGQGPFPTAIMITGSGPQDRDESLMGHRPFLVISDYLTRRGIAVLRMDDRGVGKSTGNSTRSTLEDFANDVLTGVEFLKTRKEVDAKHIGVIGHSEGGLVGPFAASRSADIAFVVMLAGTGVSGEQLLFEQAAQIARAAGATEEAIAQNRVVQQMMFDILREEKDPRKSAAEKLRAGWERWKASLPEAQRKALDSAGGAVINTQIAMVDTPEIRSFLFYEPAAVLRKVKTPVLALNGSRDLQVPPAQNLPAIVAALAAGGNNDFTVAELPGLNHLFQTCKKCTPDEYGVIEETFSPAALEIMGDWLVRHVRAQ